MLSKGRFVVLTLRYMALGGCVTRFLTFATNVCFDSTKIEFLQMTSNENLKYRKQMENENVYT